MIGRIFRLLALVGALAIAAPVWIALLLFALMVSTAIGLYLFLLLRNGLTGMDSAAGPDTVFGVIGMMLCLLPAWSAALVGVNDFETARWLSQMIGRETIGYQTESHRPGEIASTTQHIAARDLMTPDEIMQLPPHVQLLRIQGKPVILAGKLRYFADREFAGLHRSPDT